MLKSRRWKNIYDIEFYYTNGMSWVSYNPSLIRRANKKEFRKLKLEIKDLDIGEMYCVECGGTGVLVYCKKTRFNSRENISCPTCKGRGKFDWLDVMMGRHLTIRKEA